MALMNCSYSYMYKLKYQKCNIFYLNFEFKGLSWVGDNLTIFWTLKMWLIIRSQLVNWTVVQCYQNFKPLYIGISKFMKKSHITFQIYYMYNHWNLKNVKWKLKKYELQIIACNNILLSQTQMIEFAKQSWRMR